MANKQISLEQLSDIYAFRVVVDTIDDCYRVLGVAHTTWRTVPGRFKDYVSTPKQNNYQSIHTTVVGPRHQRVELQISTREMHTIAEYGVAAHAFYKDGQKRQRRRSSGDKNPCQLRQGQRPIRVASASRGDPARGRQSGGVSRAHQARAVPGPGVLLLAQGPAHRAAARCNAARFCLRRSHRRRQRRRRRLRQRPPCADRHAPEERRRGRDPDVEDAHASRRVGEPRRHRPRASCDPPRGPRRHPPPVRRARPAAAHGGVRACRRDYCDDQVKKVLPRSRKRPSTTCWRPWRATRSRSTTSCSAIAPESAQTAARAALAPSAPRMPARRRRVGSS